MAEEFHSPKHSGAEVQEKPDVQKMDALIEDPISKAVKEGETESDGMNEAPQTNGTAEHTQEGTIRSSMNIPKDTENTKVTEMTNTQDPENTARAQAKAAAPANGTPAASKRASTGGSTKKKTSAVPEHKSKKLNKKKSRPLTNLSAQPGEYYIARMKGHPPWPSIICDEDMLPERILSTRPVTAPLPDGSFKKPEYAEGGKRAHEKTYPIMFLHTNEFAWIPNTELAPLDVESDAVKNPVEKGKSKPLLEAYKKAADNEDLDHFKAMLADFQKAKDADDREKEELEKERAAKKAKKASRKNDAAVDHEDDMDMDEDAAAAKPKSKKRKKADDSDDMNEKPAKTPKTATKLKLSTPKTPATEPSTKKKASKAKSTKAAKNGSEDDAVVTPKVEEKPLTPQQAKEIKEKKVLYYRHKLQRGFLSRDTTPKEDEMKAMSDFLGELEAFPDLEGSIIRATKIHKVLRAMGKLPSIPLDEQFGFKTRSKDLLDKWNDVLSNDNTAVPSGGKHDEGKDDEAAPTTNGAAESTEEQARKPDAGDVAAPEEESGAKLENKIGTIVEGDREADKPEEANGKPRTAEEEMTDAPAIDSAPEAAYQPEKSTAATA